MLFVDKDTQEFAATTETISFPSEEYTEGIEKRLLLFDPEDSADVLAKDALLDELERSVATASEEYVRNRSTFSNYVPDSYTAAMNCDEAQEWDKACEDEMKAHRENGTFTTVKYREGMKPIGCRWVFAKKDNNVF